jgi:hypothetical protein
MWVNSYLIRRDGEIIGGLQKKQGLSLRLNGLAFKIAEYAVGLIKDVGEEVFLLATKKVSPTGQMTHKPDFENP